MERTQEHMFEDDIRAIRLALGKDPWDESERFPDRLVNLYWAMRPRTTKREINSRETLQTDRVLLMVFMDRMGATLPAQKATKEELTMEAIEAIKSVPQGGFLEVEWRKEWKDSTVVRHTERAVVVSIPGDPDERTIPLGRVRVPQTV